MRQIIRNSIQTPDGTTIESYHRHDYVSHIDKNGETYFIDGGHDYVRISVNKEPATYRFVYDNEDFLILRESFSWGTYGKDGKQPRSYILLKDMSPDHINAILETQSQIRSTYVERLFKNEIEFRSRNGI